MAKTEISVRVKEGHLCQGVGGVDNFYWSAVAGAGSVAFNVNGFDSYCWRYSANSLGSAEVPYQRSPFLSAVVFVVFKSIKAPQASPLMIEAK
jgi:hypothetical protein